MREVPIRDGSDGLLDRISRYHSVFSFVNSILLMAGALLLLVLNNKLAQFDKLELQPIKGTVVEEARRRETADLESRVEFTRLIGELRLEVAEVKARVAEVKGKVDRIYDEAVPKGR